MGALAMTQTMQSEGAAPRLFVVVAHHKSGTVWMRRMFVQLSKLMDRPWRYMSGRAFEKRAPETGAAFLFNWHGKVPDSFLARSDVGALHLIRDPRDILLSGCRYHHFAPVKGEEFLHEPRDDLGGLTYQQHLNRLETPSEKLMFEMENKHAETLAEMRSWTYGRPNVAELRYEDLIGDEDGAVMGAALTGLGFNAFETELALQAFWQNSLFGGLRDEGARTGRLSYHIQSGRPARWRSELPPDVAKAYLARHGADLIALGYARDNTWIDDIDYSPPESRAPTSTSRG